MNDTSKDENPSTPPRIGLALSGGGFRASIFHLGVYSSSRRTRDHEVRPYDLSGLWGIDNSSLLCDRDGEAPASTAERTGGTTGASRRDTTADIRGNRYQLFQSPGPQPAVKGVGVQSVLPSHPLDQKLVAHSFSLRHNSKEYDRWFYRDETLDHMPSVALPHDKTSSEAEKPSLVFTGPTVVLNTTSLLTGERKGFKREPTSRIRELNRANENILKLSRVVGASSGVPGLFPPTTILGDKLVDGGVADNQGIDVLVSLDRILTDDEDSSASDHDDFDVLLVSDASGHMEPVHRLRDRAFIVMNRTISIFQFQIRRKMLKISVCGRTATATTANLRLSICS